MHVQSVQKYCFHCQICKFVGFLLPLSSWLLKLSTPYLRFYDNASLHQLIFHSLAFALKPFVFNMTNLDSSRNTSHNAKFFLNATFSSQQLS